MISPVLSANLRWLRGYAHPRCWRQETAGRLLEVFAESRPLLSGAEAAGDRIAVLPVLYQLLWRETLATDVTSQALRTVHLPTLMMPPGLEVLGSGTGG